MPSSNVLLITNIPTPYRIPLFNELHAQLAAKGVAFKVLFAALGYQRRKWELDMVGCNFPWEVLPAGRLPSRHPEKAFFTYPRLLPRVVQESPCVIISSGFSLATTKLWLHSHFGNISYIIWSGAIPPSAGKESALRRFHRRQLVARAAGFVAYGNRARDYMMHLNAKPDRIAIGINTVDTAFFQQAGERGARAVSVVAGTTEFLCIGDLSVRKRPDLTLQAVRKLALQRRDFVLRFVGSGPEEGKLRTLARQWGIEELVVFEGFKQRGEVATLMAKADCFIFPTSFDIWGLVLVEAMAAGLVCLASERAGATCDLIEEGRTGFAMDFENSDAVGQRLRWVLEHPEEARAIGRNAQEFIRQKASLRTSAQGFVRAVEMVLHA